jgi:2-oxoglutarate ferredoxin oxidoreductase subunit delta
MPNVEINSDRCKGCETCTHACPQQILGMSKKFNAKGYCYSVNNDPSRCLGCRLCAISCPDVAIEVSVAGCMYELFSY